MNKIKGIIFDFNGPIMTEDADIVFEKHSLRRGFEKDAIKRLVKEYYKGAHKGDFKDIVDFFARTKPSLAITVDEMNEIFKEMHATKKINQETIELISSLKKQYKIALLTNFTADLEKFLKDMFNIYGLFDVVVNSYDIRVKKPDPKAFDYVLEKLNLEPSEVIFVDDKEEHIAVAKNLEMQAILYKDFKQFKADLNNILGGTSVPL